MSLFLPPRIKGSAAIALCARCQKKFYMDDLVQDPNNKLWVCKEDSDLFDPYRLPARQTENITLSHPRPDVDVSADDGSHTLVPTE